MKIRVQFFSRLREIGGNGVREREIGVAETVGEALALLEKEFPELRRWEGKLLFAIGLEFARLEERLREGDLLSIMPPVQGG